MLYSKGIGEGKNSHLSLILLSDPKALPRGSRIYTEFSTGIVDQNNARHLCFKCKEIGLFIVYIASVF